MRRVWIARRVLEGKVVTIKEKYKFDVYFYE